MSDTSTRHKGHRTPGRNRRTAIVMGTAGAALLVGSLVYPATSEAAGGTLQAAAFGTEMKIDASNCSGGYVALTFDDGPNGNTNTLLNTLKNAGVRATLFNIGQNAANNRALVAAEAAAGMWIGNHSYTHPHMLNLGSAQMSSELSQTQTAISSAGGGTPKIFRPPYGETNSTLQSAASALGLRTVTWDVDSQDWNGASTQSIVNAANSLQNGGLMLMHDQYATTIAAIPQIVNNLTARNLCAGMISSTTGRAVAPDGVTPTPTPTTPTPTTPNPTTPNPTTPNPGTGGCSAVFTAANTWNTGFVGAVKVTAGSSAITRWTVTLTIPSGVSITNVWSGTRSGSTVSNASYNGSLSAGGSTEFGFQATGAPTGLSVASCSAG